MYATTYRTFTGSIGFFAVIAVALAILETFVADIGLGVSIAVYGMVALFSHRIVLFNERYGVWDHSSFPKGEKLPLFGFLLRYGALTMIFILAALVGVIGVVMLTMNDGLSDAETIAAAVVGLFLSAPVMGLIFAKWGTIFPAVVAGGDASLKAASQRSQGRIGETFFRLMIGPFAILVATTAVFFALYSVATGWTALLAIDIVGALLGMIPTHMTAVILSQLYQDTEPSDAA